MSCAFHKPVFGCFIFPNVNVPDNRAKVSSVKFAFIGVLRVSRQKNIAHEFKEIKFIESDVQLLFDNFSLDN